MTVEPSSRTHSARPGLWVNLCHSIISLLVIRDAPLELACAHVGPHLSLPLISWPTSALVSVVAAAFACACAVLPCTYFCFPYQWLINVDRNITDTSTTTTARRLDKICCGFTSLTHPLPTPAYTHSTYVSALCMIQTYAAPLSQTGDNKYT